MVDVVGRCPACDRSGLFVGSGGYITCSNVDCPNPSSISTLLQAGDEHFVTFNETGWFIEHSLRCRVSGRMAAGCSWQAAVELVAGDGDHGRWLIDSIDSEGLPALTLAPT